jgi:hypothetical protein
VDLVGQVLSKSYLLRGVTYQGADSRDMSAFLLSLKGDKGFDDPGLRIKLSLLGHRYGLLDQYRVIDLRDVSAYSTTHVGTPASADTALCPASHVTMPECGRLPPVSIPAPPARSRAQREAVPDW